MKNPSFLLFGRIGDAWACSVAALIFTLTVVSTGDAGADTLRKEDNTDTLDQTTSWVELAVPVDTDIAQWDHQLMSANTSDLGAASSSWLGIKVLDPGGNATITGTAPSVLTVGASGMDMSAATRNLTISSPLVLGAAQTWSVASGRFLNITTPGASAIDGTGPLTINGPGGVRLGGHLHFYRWNGSDRWHWPWRRCRDAGWCSPPQRGKSGF